MLAALLVGLLVVAASAWGGRLAWRVLRIGPAYKAKVLCSLIFGSGRAIDPDRAEEVSEELYRPMRLFRVRVDRADATVTASFFGILPRTAVFRPEVGATLLSGNLPLGRTALVATPRPPGAVLPTRSGSPLLDRAVAAAFEESNPLKQRRTQAVLVMHDGRVVAERYGRGCDANTRFAGWSMAKSVINALVGSVVGQGRLALSDSALMPAWPPTDVRSTITVEDLLRMRSGLKFLEDYGDLSSEVVQMLFNEPDTAAYAAAQPLVATPGTVWSYASGTTNILSAILRRVVGEATYGSLPREALFDRIGMASAIIERDVAGTYVGSSFMLATARDWGRFGQLFLQDGVWEDRRVLPEGWVRFSTMPTPQSPNGIYGAHWWLGLKPEIGGGSAAAASIPRDAFHAIGHEGQTLTVIPSRRLVIVRHGITIQIEAWNHAQFIADICDAVDEPR